MGGASWLSLHHLQVSLSLAQCPRAAEVALGGVATAWASPQAPRCSLDERPATTRTLTTSPAAGADTKPTGLSFRVRSCLAWVPRGW